MENKFVIIIIVFVFCFTVIGCSSSKNSNKSNTNDMAPSSQTAAVKNDSSEKRFDDSSAVDSKDAVQDKLTNDTNSENESENVSYDDTTQNNSKDISGGIVLPDDEW